ncbi:MAG TPA: PaaX family transcriptional regulator C-terminal domain-containing protein [Acidimicrobiales bacterium]|nr:PaaX family transcriptional regulator C-terminal domain-containing protein [Acidimicrobiales bacterium]
MSDLGLRPLTARSVLLSVLLGSHPPELPVAALVRTAGLFGIAAGTVRVALSRMAADGEVEVAGPGRYRLAGRLLDRQRRQDESRRPPLRAWDGTWELAIADPGAEEVAAAALAAALRLGQWRPGLWGRPANLHRPWPVPLPAGVRHVVTGPLHDPAGLAATLWDLEGWAARAARLLETMASDPDPAARFAVSAAVVGHLRADPVLPAALLPPGWPGDELRAAYAGFEAELAALLASG